MDQPTKGVKNLLHLQIISLAVAVVPLIYVFVCYIIFRYLSTSQPFEGFVPSLSKTQEALLQNILLILSVLSVPMVIIARNRLIQPLKKKPPERSQPELYAMLHRITLFLLGICEWPANFGLVLFLLKGGMGRLIGFAAISLILHAMNFPTRGRVEELLRPP